MYLRSVLLQDRHYSDVLLDDVTEKLLHQEVSNILRVKYLSENEDSADEIKSKREYKGAVIGLFNRLFVSIPTSLPGRDKFINIIYLIDTGAPKSYLTHEALCAVHQRPYSKELIFPQ